MDRVLEDLEPAVALLEKSFGEGAVKEAGEGPVWSPAFAVTVDGLAFRLSYLPMPVPADILDLPQAVKYNFLLSEEEGQALLSTRSFWLLAQQGGGTDLPKKREACRSLSHLVAALLELEGAMGVHPLNRGGQLVSRAHWLRQLERMGEGVFPVPLWVWVYALAEEGRETLQTCGLADFGLPELGFLDPRRPLGELLDLLYALAHAQLMGGEPYRGGMAVPMDGETTLSCRERDGTVFFLGA